jgi:hypothetical protein
MNDITNGQNMGVELEYFYSLPSKDISSNNHTIFKNKTLMVSINNIYFYNVVQTKNGTKNPMSSL